jgi:hypothetical protein
MKLPSHLLPIIPLVASLMTAHAATHAVLPGTSTPFSPPSGPAQRLFQGPPAESKFLAVGNKYSPDSLNNPYGAGNPYNPSPVYVVPQR